MADTAEGRRVMFRSIRRRLPLSYAAIALLAALALGAVLLLTLRGYYQRVERDFLRSNGQAIAFSLAPLLDEDRPIEEIQARLVSFAFLSQTRVELLDTESQLVASSSLPGRFRVALAARSVEGPLSQRELLGPEGEGRPALIIRLGASSLDSITTTTDGPVFFAPGEIRRLPLPEEGLRRLIPPPEGQDLAVAPDSIPERTTSGQQVVSSISGSDGELLGFVRLSEGPAYAREIVKQVAWGWGIASAVAVLLAAAAGWLISRRMCAPLLALTDTTMSMAAGDLTVRADVTRRDELGDLGRSFNQMAGRVEDTVVALRRFVSDAAHEIHTPLTALHTSLELAREDDPGDGDDHLERARNQIERLEALTSGLLDLSRVEAGTETQTPTPVPLLPLVQEVSELYASRADQAGLTFEMSLPESPLSVQGDGAQLRRALGNLLDNAVKFTPPGGLVCLALKREDDRAVLRVEDSGISIPEEDLPHLFQRFHRGRNATAYPGSGLGLAIVKAIVERHAGEVQAESTPQGALFTLTLPLA
jgi:signal transduction histidine kinase